MKNVLLIGEKYSSNLGDGIICEVVEALIKKNFNVINIDLSSRHQYAQEQEDYISFSVKKEKKQYYKNKIKKILKLIDFSFLNQRFKDNLKSYKTELNNILNENKIDAIVFAGGQMFINSFINQIYYTIKISETFNIPVFFNACGFGKLIGIKNNYKLKYILNSNCVKCISVRDNFKSAKKKCKKNYIYDTYDTAILCKEFYKPKSVTKKVGLGIMISYNQNIDKQISFWEKIIKLCEENDIEWEMFCNGNIRDYLFGKYLLEKNGFGMDKIATRPTKPSELVSIITQYNKILSMRLHSLIVAYSFDIPIIGIEWDSKVLEFFKKIDLSKKCFCLKNNPQDVFDMMIGANNNKLKIEKKVNITKSIYNNINYIINTIQGEKYNEKKGKIG